VTSAEAAAGADPSVAASDGEDVLAHKMMNSTCRMRVARARVSVSTRRELTEVVLLCLFKLLCNVEKGVETERPGRALNQIIEMREPKIWHQRGARIPTHPHPA
jgi:hypothetical protein